MIMLTLPGFCSLFGSPRVCASHMSYNFDKVQRHPVDHFPQIAMLPPSSVFKAIRQNYWSSLLLSLSRLSAFLHVFTRCVQGLQPKSTAPHWCTLFRGSAVLSHPCVAFSGGSQCLDAFNVALSQAYDGGGRKRWYASTIELQLVSLDFCRACRTVPTLHVHVDESTPRSLRFPRRSETPPNTRRSKVRISNRVPVVRALSLTWALPLEVLHESAAVELWTWLELLRLRRGPSSWGSLGSSVVWSQKRLKHLVLEIDANETVAGVVWPASVQQVSFGARFNRPITGMVWPAAMKKLLSAKTSTNLSLELCGLNSFNSCRSAKDSTSPSLERHGRPP